MKECDCDKKLPDIRMVKGNDLAVVALASVYDAASGAYVAFSLGACTGVTMRLVRSFNRIEAKSISVDGDEVTATFAGSTLTTGTYGVEILFSKDGQDGRIFENDLFAIVTDSGDASIDTAAGGGNGQGYNITVDIKSRTLRIGQVSGITDYNLLENRPSIGGVTLEGNKRPSDLGMYSKEDADKRVQGMLDGKVDKEPGKGLSANDLTDERAGKVDKLKTDGRANEYLNGAGTYSRPVKQGYGVSVEDDNTVSVDPQVIARQSDVANVATDLAAQKAKEQGDIDRANAAISKEETDRKVAVAALKTLTAGHTKSIEDLDTTKADKADVEPYDCTWAFRLANGAEVTRDQVIELDTAIRSGRPLYVIGYKGKTSSVIGMMDNSSEDYSEIVLLMYTYSSGGLRCVISGRDMVDEGHYMEANISYWEFQQRLVSGANIKTINGVSVLGAGDIKTPAPTKVSELENDKGYLTKHQSLEGYYQKTDASLDHRVVAETLVSLAARLDALEGSRGLLGDATAGTVDVRGLTRCRYPLVMLAHGVPAEANVPVNLPDGLPWDGVPAFAGQQYINLDAASGGLYYAAGVDSVANWKQA